MPQLNALLTDLMSGDDAKAESAAAGLAQHGEAAAAALQSFLQSDVADQRWWATRGLAELPDDLGTDGLLQSLSDPDNSVRQCAALALHARPSPAAIETLIDCLASDDSLLSRLAGDALAATGSAAVPALTSTLQSRKPPQRIAAARALALMEHPDAIGPLFRAISDPSSMVVYWAEEGLERLGIGMTFFHP